MAINYGGRAEIVDAVNKLIAEGKKEFTEDDITNNIYSGVCPAPDMIVRTGG
ncbi:MAG: undecaprenyl diphosphate synthase family protein, partial [Clostridia bacterium]|nr:undecaprenyl diphosphate synthase family protein [Clostridia bacterium]